MAPAMLTAVDATHHVHLVIGANPLAGARCTQSLGAGATVKLIAPGDSDLHYGLRKRIEDGEVEWIRKAFTDEDLSTFGRDEVAFVVDAVFVTHGPRHPLSMADSMQIYCALTDDACRRTNFHFMPPAAYTRQCRRRPKPQHFHAPLHIYRWTTPSRCHDVGQRLQVVRADSPRDCSSPSVWPR